MDSLIDNGLSTMEAMTQYSGVAKSGPGWHSILTGVEPHKHGVKSNFLPTKYRDFDYKTFLWHAKNDYDLSTMTTFSYGSTWYTTSLIEPDGVDKWIRQSEEESTVMLEKDLLEEDYRVIFY